MSTQKGGIDSQQQNAQSSDDKQDSEISLQLLNSLSSEEYFDCYGLSRYFKDSLYLCLALQPQNEISFFAGFYLIYFSFYFTFILCLYEDYFTRVQEDTSPLILALRFITISPLNSDAYMENLASAYRTVFSIPP